jgi:hypothetical protein
MESPNGAAAAVTAITAKAKLAGLWKEKVDQHTTGSIQYERIERVIVEHDASIAPGGAASTACCQRAADHPRYPGRRPYEPIAGQLNARKVATANGGQWRHVQVRRAPRSPRAHEFPAGDHRSCLAPCRAPHAACRVGWAANKLTIHILAAVAERLWRTAKARGRRLGTPDPAVAVERMRVVRAIRDIDLLVGLR